MSTPTSPRVAIIGAGMSGLFMARRCLDLGMEFTIYEKADAVGGTWRDSVYPGLYVDIPSVDYQFSFWPKFDWKTAFASGPELRDYLEEVTDGIGVRDHIVFGTEIVSSQWEDGGWTLVDQAGTTTRHDVVIAATGFLHHPTLPNLPGADTFEGRSFHSSAWPEDLDVTGLRVGIVGTGSSGIQMVSELGRCGVDVVQFVRTPQWVEICDNPALSDDDRARARGDLDEGRTIIEELRTRINQDERLRNPLWKLEPGDLRDRAQEALREDLLQIKDPELRAALTPDYPPGCKRIPKSVHYYDAVQLENVRVVPHGVAAVTPTGVVDEVGEAIDLDVIVYATGFDTHAYMRPMAVNGLVGVSLNDVWADGPVSYRGVSIPGFPNFFLLHGPYSPVNNVPVPWTLQHETDYITELLRRVATDRVALAPTQAALERFQDGIDRQVPQTVWSDGCDSWYKAGGKAIIWPWFDKEHREMFDDVALADLEVVPLAASDALS
jgi:cation diffusion facilitator CzcD-associated flavoprotein CzcO